MNPFRRLGTVGHNTKLIVLKYHTNRTRTNGETAIGGRHTTGCNVLTIGNEESTTGVSLTALTERVHLDRAFPPEKNIFLLMMI
jgi:hypothetical protein